MSEEQNLRKFLDSDDEGMIIMGLSMAKGFKLSDDIIPKILGFFLWNDNAKIRSASRSLFFNNASNKYTEIIKKNWNTNIRTLKTKERVKSKLEPLVDAISKTSLYSLDVFTPALFRKNPSKDHYEDPRRAIISIIENFGLSAEPFLMKVVKGENIDEYGYGVDDSALDSLSEIGNLQTAIKLSKLHYTRKRIKTINRILVGKTKYDKLVSAAHSLRNGWSSVRHSSVNIKVKPEFYTNSDAELQIIQSWLNIKYEEVHDWVVGRDLGRLAFQILEQAGRSKMELCKIAISGYARDYVFNKLAKINTPECLTIILDLKPIKDPDVSEYEDVKKRYRDVVERKAYYSTLHSLRSRVVDNNIEKFKDVLLQSISEEVKKYSNDGNYEFPKHLKQISDYKESRVLNSLILMVPSIRSREFKKDFIDLIKSFSTKSSDSLLSNIHRLDLDFTRDLTKNYQIHSPDDSRVIYASLLNITEDFARLDFMLDDSFSFTETEVYRKSTKLFYHEDSLDKLKKMKSSELSVLVEKLDVGNNWVDNPDDKTKIGWIKQKMPVTLTKNEIEKYFSAKNSGTKIKIAEFIKELLGGHHYIYKNYFSEIKNEDSRKFLFSDEDANRMMGLSLSKGNKVPDEVKPIIYSIFLFDSNKDVREKAKELIDDIQDFQIPNEKEFMYFITKQPRSIFDPPSYSYGGDYESKNEEIESFKKIVNNFLLVNDKRLFPYIFTILDLLKNETVYRYLLDELLNRYPKELYNYFSEFMSKEGGLEFREKYKSEWYDYEGYRYSSLVTSKTKSQKLFLLLDCLPELIKNVNESFNLEPLIEFIYLLRLDSKEEKSTAYSTRDRISKQLYLFEKGVECVSKIDISQTLEYLTNKKLSDLAERTAFAHYLNLLNSWANDEIKLEIINLATPYIKDRSSHVRNYIKTIVQ